MSTYTVKVTETYWFYDVEADSREDAKEQQQLPIDQYDSDDYELSIEAEETDYA
tara:strand:- start:379 stop:540 length:162 start_codon:yes stop_codon:yes gene_type:complete